MEPKTYKNKRVFGGLHLPRARALGYHNSPLQGSRRLLPKVLAAFDSMNTKRTAVGLSFSSEISRPSCCQRMVSFQDEIDSSANLVDRPAKATASSSARKSTLTPSTSAIIELRKNGSP